MKKICCLLSFLVMTLISLAQTDTEFWFAAPDVQGNGSTPPQDQPIYVKLAAYSAGAIVHISIPAIGKDTMVTVNAYSCLPVDITKWKALLETTPNSAQNKGLHITSNNKITAYYEPGSPWSTEIFSLKGKNALGTDFYVPFQTYYQSGGDSGHPPYGSIVFGATQNNTTITITPTKAMVGHPAGTSFNITLNQGQTYALQNTGTGGASNPAGTHIVSDKPITVTMDDDNVYYGSCYDLAGDQIVPNTQAGQDFVFVNSGLSQIPSTDPFALSDATFGDRFYIMGTEDNTQITINKYTAGGANPPTTPVTQTINKGQQYEFVFNIAINGKYLPNSTYMHANKPVTVLQYSGFSCEASAAVLPSVGCTGSQDVIFNVNNYGSSSNDGVIRIFLITKDGAQSGFKLVINGKDVTSSIPAFFVNKDGYATSVVTFREVNNVGQVETLLGIPAGGNAPCRITNSKGIFQSGLIEAAEGTVGASYGYFTDYNIGSSKVHNVSVFNSCKPLLKTDTTGGISYQWENAAGKILDSTYYYQTKDEIFLRVVVNSTICPKIDTFNLSYMPAPVSNTVQICNDTMTFDATSSIAISYKWNDNTTQPKKSVSAVGAYSVTINDGYCDVTVNYYAVSNCGLTFKVPNVFTPNGDGINDVFKLDSITGDVDNFVIVIFNRWGRKVYESRDIYFNWSGSGLADGVYFWVIEAKGKNNETLKPKGTVTIIR